MRTGGTTILGNLHVEDLEDVIPPAFFVKQPRLFVARGLGTWEAPFELNVADPL